MKPTPKRKPAPLDVRTLRAIARRCSDTMRDAVARMKWHQHSEWREYHRGRWASAMALKETCLEQARAIERAGRKRK